MISERIAKGRQAAGLNQSELARRLGVKPQAVQKWEAGGAPRREREQDIAKELGVSLAWLRGEVDELEENTSIGPDIKGKLPLVSWVQAGSPEEVIDNLQPGDAEEWLDSPFPYRRGAYLLRVDGMSMWRPDGSGYNHGEIIQVQPGLEYKNGSDVIARGPAPDHKGTFKRFIQTPDGEYLEAINPDWPERIIRMPMGTVIAGVVVGSWRDRRR